MNWKKQIVLLIVLTVFLAACGGAASEYDAGDSFAAEEAREIPASEPAQTANLSMVSAGDVGDDILLAEDSSSGETGANTAVQTFPQERMIIRNADLSLVVVDTDSAMAAITEMAESNGGWVVSSNVYQYNEDAKTGSITVRVPSTGFTSALEAMKGLAVEVTNESTSGQDVTDEFVDLSLQLENLEATAARVRSFLDESRNVEEALAVNMELSRLEGDIERIKGRMQFLSQSASYSTITVNLTPDVLSQPIEVAGWQPRGIAREAIESLIAALQGTVSFVIWVGIYVLPLGLLYGLPVWLVVRLVRRWWLKRRMNTAVSDAVQS